MPKIGSEKSNMTSTEFAQGAFQERIAPPSLGSVKARLRHAVRVVTSHEDRLVRQGLREDRLWTPNRVRDCWYADPRIKPDADEIRDLEEITGLRYGRQELAELETIIARADALLDGPEADFYRPFVDGLRAFFGAVHRAGTPGRNDDGET